MFDTWKRYYIYVICALMHVYLLSHLLFQYICLSNTRILFYFQCYYLRFGLFSLLFIMCYCLVIWKSNWFSSCFYFIIVFVFIFIFIFEILFFFLSLIIFFFFFFFFFFYFFFFFFIFFFFFYFLFFFFVLFIFFFFFFITSYKKKDYI